MDWIWDEAKNRANKRNHGLSFETAQLVFEDPLAAMQKDSYPQEQRWRTMGAIGSVVVMVVHTCLESESATGEHLGRIISARKATRGERKAYEETY